MSAADRAACKAMGRECCRTQSGGVSHASRVAGPALAVAPAVPSLKAPAAPRAFDRAAFGRVLAAPALVQGVGLFAFLSTFLI